MTSKYSEMLDMATHYSISPATIQQKALDILDSALGGEVDLVDPTNPFIMLLEASSTEAAAAMIRAEALTRKQYPKLAQQFSDLYPHMSDSDFIGRFATPATTNIIRYVLSIQQIKQFAITDPISGLDKVVLPRDTQFSVGGASYYMHYPIVITVMPSGELHAGFDQSIATPMKSSIQSNVLDYRTIRLESTDMLEISIPTDQLLMETVSSPVNAATGWSLEVVTLDQFHYARVYTTTDNVTWTEINVTHDEMVHDITIPTAVIRVEGQKVYVKIPDIYITAGSVGTTARMDVYTTKGVMSVDLSDYAPQDWTVSWKDASNLSPVFSAPLPSITTTTIYSTSKVSGGTNGMSFEDLREQVVYSPLNKPVPVTDKELEIRLKALGYGITKQKDTVTERTFVSTRQIVADEEGDVSSSIGVTNSRVLIDSARTDLPTTMRTNGDRLTITPDALFKEDGNGVMLASDSEYTGLLALNQNDLTDGLNNGRYYYTPFHYVLDATEPVFTARSYYLGAPSEVTRSYMATSSALGYVVATTSLNVLLEDGKYKITVIAAIPSGLTDVHLQLAYTDTDSVRHHLTAAGVTVDPTSMKFTFELATNFDITKDQLIDISNLLDDTLTVSDAYVPLEAEYDLVYVVETVAATTTGFDAKIVPNAFGTIVSGITYEKSVISLGTHLEGLYVKTRSILSPPTYSRYPADVPELYTKVEYAKDSVGAVYTIDPVTDKIEFTIAHNVGDPKLDDEGNPIYLHREGDPVKDGNGNLVVDQDSSIVREVRFMLLDGRYRFATTNSAMAYRDSIPLTIIDYLKNDINVITAGLIERTNLFFEPKATLGSGLVKLGASRHASMNTALKFRVTFLMTEAGYQDDDLRTNLIANTKATIADELTKRTLSMSNLGKRIDNLAGDNVVDVDITSPIPGGNAATLIEGNVAFSIASEIRPLTNGMLDIVDSIDFIFNK